MICRTETLLMALVMVRIVKQGSAVRMLALTLAGLCTDASTALRLSCKYYVLGIISLFSASSWSGYGALTVCIMVHTCDTRCDSIKCCENSARARSTDT